MHKYFIFFLLLFFCFTRTHAQNSDYTDTSTEVQTPQEEVPTVTTYDQYSTRETFADTTLSLRVFALNKDSVLAKKSRKEYAWIKDLDSLLKDEQERNRPKPHYERRQNISFMEGLFNSPILQVLLWVIAGSIVLYIIYRLFLSKGLFGISATKAIKEEPEEEEETLNGKDFNSLVNKAVAAGDLRSAVRWLFLLTLQKLDEKELIRFGADKTNSTYMNELPPAKRNDFASLSLYYEYTWYGKAPLNKESFEMIRGKFTEFLNRI